MSIAGSANDLSEKLLSQLKGQDWADFADPVIAQVSSLKKFAYGKQLASVERLLGGRQLPPHMQSSGMNTPSGESSMVPTPLSASEYHFDPQDNTIPSIRSSNMDPHLDARGPGGNGISAFTHTYA